MYRDTHTFETAADASSADWEIVPAKSKPAPAPAPASGEDEVGAVWHVYREIARRIPRHQYTRHASTLGADRG